MDFNLTDAEVRVLGCLLEKEISTPDYYPLTLNALVNACNQKTNRNPVVSYDENSVIEALDNLKKSNMVWQISEGRTPKYGHTFSTSYDLERNEAAVLCLLLLRGPQTIGELRGRSDRMFEFDDLQQVGDTLTVLDNMGFAKILPRQPGQKESRYAHLFSGEPVETASVVTTQHEAATLEVRKNERIAALEARCDELQSDLEALRQEFLAFKRQFE